MPVKRCLNEKVELLCKLAMPRLSSGVCLQAGHASPVKWCLNEKVELLCKAGHALPVKWCLKAKVLLGKWSAIAMLELQHIRFAGWALTEGQHRPKAGRCRFLDIYSSAYKTMFRYRFLAIVDVRTIYRYHACQECLVCEVVFD